MREHYFFSSVTRISDLETKPFQVRPSAREEWAEGDYVMVEVTNASGGRGLELASGRTVELARGDLLVGALGDRFATLEATGSWRQVSPDGRMEILSGGGLLGRLTSRSLVGDTYVEVVYRGHLWRGETRLAMEDFVEAPEEDRTYALPTVMIVGTSMSAGKTTAAAVIIRRLRQMGFKVLGAKVTGAGRYRDVLSMHDAGANRIFDFVDAGLPSTVCPEPHYRNALRDLLSRMAGVEADVSVVEIGASPLEPYNGATAVEMLEDRVELMVLCASDPYAVVGLMDAFERKPDMVTGITSNTEAGIRLAERLSGLPCLNIRDKDALPELDRILKERFGDAPGSGGGGGA